MNVSGKKNKSIWATSAVALALSVAGIATTPSLAWAAEPATVVNPNAMAGLPDFTALVDQVGPAVVNIRTTERITRRVGPARGGMDEDMLEFFRQFGLPVPSIPQVPRSGGAGPESRVVPRGVGSGFILSPDGYVLTNAHVVAGAEDVTVTLTDKREFEAKVIGLDERTDVALLKIEAANLPFVRVGNVEDLKVGQWVIAIGSPFGLENTVTAGIVSAKQRDTGEYLPFIQTDVAVNPGNSGGPLINMRGEVVGINSQIYSRSGGFMGISFAIPIDDAIKISDQLKSTGRVVRGRIGVQIGPVSSELAESLGLKEGQVGALVSAVEKDSPADKAGVQAGDIITAFNGTSIAAVSDLPRLVGNTKPGTKAELDIFRRGKAHTLNVTIEEIKDNSASATGQDAPNANGPATANQMGLVVQNLTNAQRSELGIKGGVMVNESTGSAAQSGIRPGDVIMAIGQTEVLDLKSFEAAVKKLDSKRPASVLVRRGEWAQYVLVRPEAQ